MGDIRQLEVLWTVSESVIFDFTNVVWRTRIELMERGTRVAPGVVSDIREVVWEPMSGLDDYG